MAVRPKRGRISIIWIIPILAALVAVGIGIQRIRNEGTTITIVFSEGDGIEANKTLIKYKDVTIGRVTAVQLTDDYAKVSVTAKIAKHAEGLLVDDAKFWVVRPNISLSGISGLSTLLSGNYIEFQSGKSTDSRDSFVGLDVAPVITRQQGREFILNATDLGSLDIGSPIYYRRLQVGQVIAYDLTPDGKAIRLKVFVNAPYDKFVFPGTRFWNASGLDVAIGADGVAVRTESLVALLAGGIAFDTPPFVPVADPSPANAAFTLYPTRSAALKTPDGVGRTYVLYFNESMRGLSVGAPVTFLGLPAGEVTSVGLAIDAAKADIRPRVTISFYPDRLIALATAETGTASIASVLNDEPKRRAFLKRIIEERGLRAQLRSGSLITGQMYVAFDYYPGAAKTKLDLNQPIPELPVVPGTLAALEAKLTSILDKVDKMPFEALGNDLKKDLEDLDQTLAGATKLMSDADVQLMPQLKVDIEDLHRTLAGVERAINNADTTLLSPNAPGQQDLRNALQEFTRAARSLRALADQLERQPSSLIRGKTEPSSGGK
jgi:paraquat-inducible protein B